jgi:hypothetical protein
MRRTSGTYNFQPAIADLLIEAYDRIQIRGPQLLSEHIISARRSSNLILQDWSGNRGVNLAQVGDELLCVPLNPGQSTYQLPWYLVQIFDAYLRYYQPNSTFATLGSQLTPMTAGGAPVVTSSGEPMVLGPGTGVLSTIAGNPEIVMNWPAHGLIVGAPIFWQTPTSIATMLLQGMSVVDRVIDSNTVQFLGPYPAPATSTGQGAPPLFSTLAGFPMVDVILPNHGQTVGSMFTTQIPCVVGGLTVPPGSYPVTAVLSSYEFQFEPGIGNFLTADCQFENLGQIGATSQTPQNQWNDVYLWPLSRTEYAELPNKLSPGRPTQYWFDRTISPSLTMWPVPPPNSWYAFIAYRMRQIQDANPVGGQVLDIPNRALQAFTAELTAAVSEKYAPAQWVTKIAAAKEKWDQFALADTEYVSSHLQPDMSGYFGSY